MIHSTSEVSPEAVVRPGTKVWARTQLREGRAWSCPRDDWEHVEGA
jgi:hypothetical protein